MLIHEKSLRVYTDLQNVKIKGDLSLNGLQAALIEKSNEYGVPLNTELKEVKKAGILMKATVPCLEYYHPTHPSDYFRYVITSERRGLYTYFKFFYHGSSPNHGLINKRDDAKKDGGVIGMLSGAVRGVIVNTKHDEIEEEEHWYDTMRDIIDEIIV